MKYKKEIEWILRDKYEGKLAKLSTEDLVRLKTGEPVDYIIGWREFLGCRIDLSARPLIPREETEYWVEKAIGEIKNNKTDKIKCLDIFAGSGCIGLAVLKYLPNVKVDFAEKSAKMVGQIKLNIKLAKVAKSRSRAVVSDIFSKVPGRYDYIFANPPYIPSGRKLSAGVTRFEPNVALFGSADGLFYIKKFLKVAADYLNIGGKIYLEFDAGQKRAIEQILGKLTFSSYQFNKDQFGRWRYIVLVR